MRPANGGARMSFHFPEPPQSLPSHRQCQFEVMPSTYNGIGTHYYGKKNIQKRPGPCPHCHRAVELTSYDTILWFVVVFIPLIPIRRKRIIDYCPACTRHFAVDLEKWETAKQLEIS